MIFSVDRRPSSGACDAGGVRLSLAAGPPVGAGAGASVRCTRATAATRILSTISLASSLRPLATPTRGLATKSTAPSSSAFMVTSAPRSVSVEIISTGMGRKRISRPRKSMPSMRGISTSSVITSGSISRIISRAIRGSLAVPMHSMSVCRLMISDKRLRTSAESSTTITRVFLFIRSDLSQNRSTEPPAVVRARMAAFPRTDSCATRESGCAWASRLTRALPVAGKYTTLRG
ncbi:hypothetical protein D3C78_1173510 [compost metagenome]